MLALIVVLGATTAGALVLALGIVFDRGQATVERQLAGYDVPDPAARPAAKESAALGPPETAVVQQAVELTSRIAARAGLLARVEHALEQADVSVRAGEVMFYVPTFAILVFLLFAIIGGPIIGIVGAGAVVLLPILYIMSQRRRRMRAFERQLPDTLVLLASSMRAGFSLMQGLEAVSQEIGEPMRRELQRVFTEVRLGRVAEDALDDVARRLESRDLEWTVMALRIQREVGGNLAALLDTVADTMQKRERLRREVSALTAEGRLSAVILSIFPPVLAVLMWLLRPGYMEELFKHALGWLAVLGSIVLAGIGWIWLMRIVDIEA